MCERCRTRGWDTEDTTLYEAVVSSVDSGEDLDAAVRLAVIHRMAYAANEYERSCAVFMFAQQIFPDLDRSSFVDEYGNQPQCNGESLSGVYHEEGCGRCREYPDSCCSWCSSCESHHDEDGDEYIGGNRHCDEGFCHDCDHECENP